MKSIEKLREWSHRYDNAWIQEDGSVMFTAGGGIFSDGKENYGESIRSMVDAIEAEIAERYIELPLDADGVPIRIGDTVIEVDDTVSCKVMSLHLFDDGCWDVNTVGMNPNLLRHVKKQDLKDVLLDLVMKTTDINVRDLGDDIPDALDALIGEYADKVREAVGE